VIEAALIIAFAMLCLCVYYLEKIARSVRAIEAIALRSAGLMPRSD
jgi:hypothetical protein